MWMLKSCVSSLRQSPCGQTKAKTSTAQPILDHTKQRLSELRFKLMICKPEGYDDHSMRETNCVYTILITFKLQNIFAIASSRVINSNQNILVTNGAYYYLAVLVYKTVFWCWFLPLKYEIIF